MHTQFMTPTDLPTKKDNSDVMNRVTRWRKAAGLTQAAAAARIGVQLRTFSRWEKGVSRPTGLYAQLLEKVMEETTTK